MSRLVECESPNHKPHKVPAKSVYRCAGCGLVVCPADGAADDMPDHCDSCWVKAHQAEAGSS